ncbi:Rz1-like lysis system protein LysC [Pasteurella sp. PK-2025]|uniref:Rz1-like lysis system protein LysC n=1 Tax=unclassified Pasteurella TaxID=2621516 RepID=UPI003C725053
MKQLILFHMKKKALVLTVLLLLVLLLSSCVSKPVVQACPQIPAALLAHLDKTGFTGQTYGDVSKYAVILKRERDVCLNRIDKIREWQTENTQN